MQFLPRALLFVAVLAPASASLAAVGDPCTPDVVDPATGEVTTENFEESCAADGSISICDDTDAAAPVEAALTCSAAFGITNDGACTTSQGCVGSGCTDGLGCEAPIGGGCIGYGVNLTSDTTDDNAAFGVMCEDAGTCVTGVSGNTLVETCVAHLGPTCAPGVEDACAGNTLVFCLGTQDGTITLTSNAGLDCASLIEGGTCGRQPCECDANCGTGGTCTDGFCGAGNTCVGPVDSSECTAGGEGEGEGEGEAGGEGEGEDDTPGRGSNDGDAEPAPGGCSSVGGVSTSFAGLLLALVAVRRRRR